MPSVRHIKIMEPTNTISIAIKIGEYLLKPLVWVWKYLRLQFFRLRDLHPPYNASEAARIAHAVLAGSIVEAVSFRAFGSRNSFITAVRAESDNRVDLRVYVLQQAGETFITKWTSDILYGLCTPIIEIVEVLNNGYKEIAFIEEGWGNSGGSRKLSVYSHSLKKLFEIVESQYWANASGPISPTVEITGDPDGEYMHGLERLALRHGFLKIGPLPDLEDPKFAIQRWHKENGEMPNGTVSIRYFSGICRLSIGSVVQELNTPDVLFVAYFKGPIIGYPHASNNWFVAYSPANIYDWAKVMIYEKGNVWFGRHCQPGLCLFRLEPPILKCFTHYAGNQMPEISSLELRGDIFVVNDSEIVNLNDLDKLRTRD